MNTLEEAQLKVGDEFVVWAEARPTAGPLEAPNDLVEALASDPEVDMVFQSHPPNRRREYVEYVKKAKMSDTRMGRIGKTLDRLKEKRPEA